MQFNIANLVAIGGFVLTVFTSVSAGIFWYVSVEKRKYGLERDFAHLKRNYDQIQNSLSTILKELDNRFDRTERDIWEIKTTLNLPIRKHETD